jgi:Leucine-rich repeat (LRR) protein
MIRGAFFFIIMGLFAGCALFSSRTVGGIKGKNYDRRGLMAFPEEIFEDTSLRSLSLFGNKLSDVPAEISVFSQLETLYLGRNSFEKFPEEICALKKLRILSLAYNDIDSIPDCICEMPSLEWIYLNNNKLVHLPDSIGRLRKLEQLTLKRNSLKKLPEDLYNAESLQVLDLGYNELSALDSSLARLKQLKILKIYRAGFLISVPESICRLRFLEQLYIDNSVVLPTCVFARQTNRLQIYMDDL